MANSLTNLAADIYKAADIVGRELVGFIPSVVINSDAGVRVAKGDTVRSFFTRKATVNTTYTPSMTIPEGDDQTVDNATMTVNQVANVKIPWTGEDEKHVDNGSGFETVFGDQIAQAMRGITNTIEAFIGTQMMLGWSRGWGTPGTTPFASNFNELANLAKMLKDNGCPFDGQITAVFDTLSGVNIRNLSQLQKVNESGDSTLLRQGTLLNLQGLRLKESAGVGFHTKGTGASYVTNGTQAAGALTVAAQTGSGTILAGDGVTLATDYYGTSGAGTLNAYNVSSALSAGSFGLNKPGLRNAVATSQAITVLNSYTGNVAFHKNSSELVCRPPAMPKGGDAADDVMTVQDPWSGLVYDIRVYRGYGKVMFDITTFYDFKVWKPEFVVALFG